MDDVREISAELHRLADSAPSDPFDTTQLLARGHRGRRRRTLLGIGGAVAAVAAIAVGASLLPAGAKPDVANDTRFSPVPGVPRGEEAADQVTTRAEAARRCALRYPNESVTFEGPSAGTTRVGQFITVKIGGRSIGCIVPGGDRPSAELEAALAKDRLPVATADKLRNCSVLAWVDLSKWQVVATDMSKGLGRAALVAVSPSGQKAVECELTSNKDRYDRYEGATEFVTLSRRDGGDAGIEPAGRSERGDQFATGTVWGGACSAPTGICNGDAMVGWGRVASEDALAVRLRIGNRTVYQVPVGPGGWFAFTWQAKPYQAGARPGIAAYDREGRVVKTFR